MRISEMRDISTFDVIKEMGIGINLGNTFDCVAGWIDKWGPHTPHSYETAWGSPIVTQDIIRGYAKEGFGVLRIPVAWSNLMSTDGKYTISSDYIARIKKVINWTLEENMYVIVNLHWDGGWLKDLPTNYEDCMDKYTAVWRQLCKAFISYGDRLIFESQNEELGWQDVWNHWAGDSGKKNAYDYCNKVNQRFVDIVRNSGGNNKKRHLLISGYYTDLQMTCDPMFKMPEDAEKRCAVSVHYYTPSTFAIIEEDASWGKSSYTWGTEEELSILRSNMDKLKSVFLDNGIPVIMGEYGCPRNNKDPESVRLYITSICEEAFKRGGVCPILWDTPQLHYDRYSHKMNDLQLIHKMREIRDRYLKN